MENKTDTWSGRNLKKKVYGLLEADDFKQGLEILLTFPARRVINPLFSFFCSLEPEIRWRAITVAGVLVANLAVEDMESARVVMRRMIWNLNDESGGIGWGMPEAMGESMAGHEGLAREYGSILISYIREDGNFLEYEPLQNGALWGIGRLAQKRPELVAEAVPHLSRYLVSRDATNRALAAWIMGLVCAGEPDPNLEKLAKDDTQITLWGDGTQRICRVSELAKQALKHIRNQGIRNS